MVKKMFIEIKLCNPTTYVFKGHVKIVKFYMLKFKGTIMQIWKSANIFICWRFYIKTFYILRHAHIRYVKSLFTNI